MEHRTSALHHNHFQYNPRDLISLTMDPAIRSKTLLWGGRRVQLVWDFGYLAFEPV